MITSIAMLPPSAPVGEPPASSAASADKTQKSNSAATDQTSAAAPTAFKQALQNARGKHKPAQPTPTPTATVNQSATPVVAKAKPAPVAQSDDEQTDTADPSASADEETSETLAKTATTTATAVPTAAKTVAKKVLTAATEEEPETAAMEPTKKPQQTNIVQAITPDAKQSSGQKQQKSNEKATPKTDLTINPATPVATNPTNVPVPAPPSVTDSSKTSAPTDRVATDATNPARANQPGIKPRAARKTNPSLNQTAKTNAAADSAVASSDSTVSDSDTDADADAASDANSSAASTASAVAPAQHPVAAIADSLGGLAAMVPAHSSETTSSSAASSASASPTRAFAEANQDQIVTTIKGQLLPDGGSMQITLHPDNLGHVRISVQVSAGSVSATFETSNDQATRLLSHNLGQLKQTLESAGVSVEKLQVTQSRDPQSQTQSDSKQSSQQQQQTATDQRSSHQEQQRREILQQMWDKITGGQDWVDVKA